VELEIFAAKLRTLRQRAGLSQEALAARLGVSAQSVSKWENAANWPEAVLILPLARLLGVSADELLTEPTSREEWEKRWQEIEGEYRQRGDHAALLALAEAALKEWPGDRDFRFRQANEEYQLAARTEDEPEREKLLHLSEGHFSQLVRESPDNAYAGAMLVQILLALGRREEAEALVRKLPCGEKLALILHQGKERDDALRREIAKTAVELLNLLQSEGSEAACAVTAAILASAGEPKTLIWYRLNLQLQRARLACGEAADAAMEALGEMVAAAKAYAAPAPSAEADAFFSELPEAAAPSEVRRWIADALAEECFSSLRELPAFSALEREAALLPA
jgi:transcriptional regulator with XRE-family HTH domain